MYDPAVLTGCTYGLHAYSEWMQTPMNLWGPLYMTTEDTVSSIEYCKARWPECLETCTIFFLEWYKAYSFTYKAVDFAISTINILIIDVNIAHVEVGVEFVSTCGAIIGERFMYVNC